MTQQQEGHKTLVSPKNSYGRAVFLGGSTRWRWGGAADVLGWERAGKVALFWSVRGLQ